jgi:hypothetical protein
LEGLLFETDLAPEKAPRPGKRRRGSDPSTPCALRFAPTAIRSGRQIEVVIPTG